MMLPEVSSVAGQVCIWNADLTKMMGFNLSLTGSSVDEFVAIGDIGLS